MVDTAGALAVADDLLAAVGPIRRKSLRHPPSARSNVRPMDPGSRSLADGMVWVRRAQR
ncbi:hypothetical protein [Williamsia sp. Leaf354]|uniref:hypothetical protein n=1 Tax=Williamsia sp. Leaf354 TaxID=1736349 RepID=UPI001F3A8762|nr:hypothetical protein [Williamsia sp. Leaf354]